MTALKSLHKPVQCESANFITARSERGRYYIKRKSDGRSVTITNDAIVVALINSNATTIEEVWESFFMKSK